ncbi:MAG: hypothetical protein CMM58_09495 [Rhodospirillaceae bacterium]|nr:hypothetical protein [Rhodospirillaceae bacterium]|tara:strand:+ start:2724 stop:4472 length:1749 start_codon:yes stop_codon:yes gene_type:complete
MFRFITQKLFYMALRMALTRKLLAVFIIVPAVFGCVTPQPEVSSTSAMLSSSGAGHYLRGRLAYKNYDLKDAAASFETALKKSPNNPQLLRNSFVAELESGNISRAIKLMEYSQDKTDYFPFEKLVLGLNDVKYRNWAKSIKNFNNMAPSQLNSVLRPLLIGWAMVGQNKLTEARKTFSALENRKGFELLGLLHTALAFQGKEANKITDHSFEKALNYSPPPPRLLLAAASHYSKSKRVEEAVKLIQEIKSHEYDYKNLEKSLKQSDPVGLAEISANSVKDGIAEVLFDISKALQDDFESNRALIFVQLALYLRPTFPQAQILLGELLHDRNKYSEAIAEYKKIPQKSIFYPIAQFRQSSCLTKLNEPEAAIKLLKLLAQRIPNDPNRLAKIGDIQRTQKNWHEAINAYNDAIAFTTNIQQTDWILFYSRGIAYEQSKNWDLAEQDFLEALKLAPNQPFVMNYLGYAWTELGINLNEAERMIKKAVKLRPSDGYITDSLGWVLYRTSKFSEAVPILERAVQLRPNDAIINDHLGDAYWQVGRQTEAYYQWSRALTMEPDQKLSANIKNKVKNGLKSPHSPGK